MEETIKFFTKLPVRIPLKHLTNEYVEEYDRNFQKMKDACEKQIPFKPIVKRTKNQTHYTCKCGVLQLTLWDEGNMVQGVECQYCHDCGQKLDWSDSDNGHEATKQDNF